MVPALISIAVSVLFLIFFKDNSKSTVSEQPAVEPV
jgi:hypothetical protein